jgi:hypothetical protein
MMTRRPASNLPGQDGLLVTRIAAMLFLVMAVLWLALDIAEAAGIGGMRRVRGHLPWPIAQWALYTPLGTLILVLVGALMWSAPFTVVALAGGPKFLPMDVTDLPVSAWPRPPTPRRRPEGGTRADRWFGRGTVARVWNALALILGVVLLIGILAGLIASFWYSHTIRPDCHPAGCPPSFDGRIAFAPEFIAVGTFFVGIYARFVSIERQSGVWFRSPYGLGSGPGLYVRRPGVAPETAAAALRRYTPGILPPVAPNFLRVTLFGSLMAALFCGSMILSAWLAAQWIPG